MKKLITILITVLCIFPVLYQTAAAENKGETFATVNAEKIPLSLFQAAVKLEIASAQFFHSGEIGPERRKDIEEKVSDRLLRRSLALQEARNRQVLPKQSAIDEYLNRQAALYGGEEKLRSFISSADIPWDDYIQLIKDSYVSTWYLRQLFIAEVVVTKRESSDYYSQRVYIYAPPGRGKISLIKFTVPDHSPDKEKILGAIKSLSGFTDRDSWVDAVRVLKSRYQPDLGVNIFFGLSWKPGPKGNLIWSAIEKKEPQTAVYLKESETIHHSIFIEELEIPPQRSYEEARESIEKEITFEKVNQLIEDKLTEMMEQADIRILYP